MYVIRSTYWRKRKRKRKKRAYKAIHDSLCNAKGLVIKIGARFFYLIYNIMNDIELHKSKMVVYILLPYLHLVLPCC